MNRLCTLLFALLVLALTATPASAFRVAYGPNSGTVTLPNIDQPNGFGTGGSGQVSKVAGGVRFAKNGTVLFGTAQGTMSVLRDVALHPAARGAARALPAAAAGVFLFELGNQIGCRGVLPQLDAFLECDPGSAPTTGTAWRYDAFAVPGVWFSTPQAAAYASCSAQNPNLEPGSNLETLALMRGQGGDLTTVHGGCQGIGGPCCTGTTWTVGAHPYEAATCPGGLAVRPDGLCPTSVYTPASEQAVADKIEQHPGFIATPEGYVREAVDHGVDFGIDASPETLTGPETVTGPTTTITTTPTSGPATSTTVQQEHNVTYQNNTYNYTTTTTTVSPEGTTTTTQAPEIETCGLPGKPPCKIDEEGTAEFEEPEALFDPRDLDRQNMEEAVGGVFVPTFGFIDAPPVAACTNVDLPNDMGVFDICGPVEMIRSIMAYLWAIAGAWLCLGFIRDASHA
jgi:hypothetical protein